MFTKLLIANRGEIACRVIKTAKKLKIRTIAVYSEIDAHAQHVQMADESFCIGSAPSSESYLNIQKIIEVARLTKTEAIHPGYGFLSEDANFALACQQAGIVFVGPSPEAIRIMGDKNLAKNTMIAAKVPVIPGYNGENQDLLFLKKIASQIGLPILIKASAGGGGKGMRLVEKMEDLENALESAQREAQSSFGDSRVFLEKYLTHSRHVEVQILFDQYGKGIYLFDRDCSIQRRHQKIIEEAPAPFLKPSTRKKMAKMALQAGAAIHYSNVGTIEFLVDEQENFYFMEMNTRLQVEHPVTEMITGLDLVEWQLRIASGEKLTLNAEDIKEQGHAIEARLYAENPENNFMPSPGILQFFQLPNSDDTMRVDSGFQAGDSVSIFYDPLLAKLIAWGRDRSEALQILQRMLKKIALVGISSNSRLLNRIINNSNFIRGKITTQFIPQHKSQLLSNFREPDKKIFDLAICAFIKKQEKNLALFKNLNQDAFSPWFNRHAWRLSGSERLFITFWYQGKAFRTLIDFSVAEQYQWLDEYHITWLAEPAQLAGIIYYEGSQIYIFSEGEEWLFDCTPPLSQDKTAQNQTELQAPMPGTLIKVYVKPGQSVSAGARLLVIEAMKMEHALHASHDAIVQKIFFKPGDKVSAGAQLILFNE